MCCLLRSAAHYDRIRVVKLRAVAIEFLTTSIFTYVQLIADANFTISILFQISTFQLPSPQNQELFEDIGDLLESRLVRPGIAEVIYRNLKDAERAVDAYHNRQLDGQPMNCLLVNPRATYKPTATTTSTAMKYGR